LPRALSAPDRLRREKTAGGGDLPSSTEPDATATAEIIQHCVVVEQENSNTVTCRCQPATTLIDSKTGHTTLVCKKMKEEK
jgi:hypothetical protein